MAKARLKLEEILPRVKKNANLQEHNTYKIKSRAKYFFTAKSKKDIINAVLSAKQCGLPFFLLGHGSNVLFSDKGYNGLIIKIANKEIKKIGKAKIFAQAGTPLRDIVSFATRASLSGMEWASGIYGTLGGAIFGNAGSFGKAMEDDIESIEVFDLNTNKIAKFHPKDCKFKYRRSIFKEKHNLIILSSVLVLTNGKQKEILKKMKSNLAARRAAQPLEYPSAGSVFKNPPGFYTGKLIEECGLKGKTIGDAQISEKHANFFINLGNAKASDIKKLVSLARRSVKKKFGVNLENENIILD